MTVKDVIDRVGEWSKDLSLPEEQMIRLINEVDGRLWDTVISRRVTDMEYTEHTDINDELLAEGEYGDIYVHYILATAYTRLYESERAAYHTSLFNELYNSCGNRIIREYPPVPCAKITV